MSCTSVLEVATPPTSSGTRSHRSRAREVPVDDERAAAAPPAAHDLVVAVPVQVGRGEAVSVLELRGDDLAGPELRPATGGPVDHGVGAVPGVDRGDEPLPGQVADRHLARAPVRARGLEARTDVQGRSPGRGPEEDDAGEARGEHILGAVAVPVDDDDAVRDLESRIVEHPALPAPRRIGGDPVRREPGRPHVFRRPGPEPDDREDEELPRPVTVHIAPPEAVRGWYRVDPPRPPLPARRGILRVLDPGDEPSARRVRERELTGDREVHIAVAIDVVGRHVDVLPRGGRDLVALPGRAPEPRDAGAPGERDDVAHPVVVDVEERGVGPPLEHDLVADEGREHAFPDRLPGRSAGRRPSPAADGKEEKRRKDRADGSDRGHGGPPVLGESRRRTGAGRRGERASDAPTSPLRYGISGGSRRQRRSAPGRPGACPRGLSVG